VGYFGTEPPFSGAQSDSANTCQDARSNDRAATGNLTGREQRDHRARTAESGGITGGTDGTDRTAGASIPAPDRAGEATAPGRISSRGDANQTGFDLLRVRLRAPPDDSNSLSDFAAVRLDVRTA